MTFASHENFRTYHFRVISAYKSCNI